MVAPEDALPGRPDPPAVPGGEITPEIAEAGPFDYAEDHYQE
jgi:hypothetical protein